MYYKPSPRGRETTHWWKENAKEKVISSFELQRLLHPLRGSLPKPSKR